MLTNVDWYKFLIRNREPTTARTYSMLLNGYCKSIKKFPIGLNDIQSSKIEDYMSSFKSQRTANTFLTAVRSFAKWVRRNEPVTDATQLLLLENLARSIDGIEYKKVPRPMRSEALRVDALKTLLSAVENDDLMWSATVVHFYFGARPIEIFSPFIIKEIYPNYAEIMNVVDFTNNLMSIVTAKTNRTRFRIVPFPDEVKASIRKWVDFVNDKVKTYSRPGEWYTKSIKPYCKSLGLRVTGKTGRKTVETELSRAKKPQWMIDYWLGHLEGISGEYRDKSVLIDELRSEIADKHYILEVI